MTTMAAIAFIFPGQGSQKVGMGRGWAERSEVARATFEEADEALGFSLSRLCWEGPAEELQLTMNTQPAILATSVAIERAVASTGVEAAVMAGHSLGEYSALVAAGALRFADALRLVRKRGELMQMAVPVGEGAMAAILGLEADVVVEVAAAAGEGEVCAVANFNSPQQTVIAGQREAVERAMTEAKARGAKRTIALPVSAPFHCSLMRPARDGLEPLLAATEFADPRVPVVNNVDAEAEVSGADARQALVRQVDGAVRWLHSVRLMVEQFAVGEFLELGPGSVLSGLVRRIVPAVATASLAEPQGFDRWVEAKSSK